MKIMNFKEILHFCSDQFRSIPFNFVRLKSSGAKPFKSMLLFRCVPLKMLSNRNVYHRKICFNFIEFRSIPFTSW